MGSNLAIEPRSEVDYGEGRFVIMQIDVSLMPPCTVVADQLPYFAPRAQPSPAVTGSVQDPPQHFLYFFPLPHRHVSLRPGRRA